MLSLINRDARRARVRGPAFEVFGTSNFGSRISLASRFSRYSRDNVQECHSSKRPLSPQRNRRFSAGRLVHLVDLVHLVYLVGLVQPNKQDKPNKRDRPLFGLSGLSRLFG